ncbi:hypothetical protein BHUM_04213c [Candidatus Burkholderia humilis]|nr:hypothetical protein BHUM_04213c [Candidatus Burkholderia humilis]
MRVSYEGSSRVNPFMQTALNLYAMEGKTLRPVLDRLIIDTSNGEWNGQCTGEFDKTVRTIGMGPAGASGYAAERAREDRPFGQQAGRRSLRERGQQAVARKCDAAVSRRQLSRAEDHARLLNACGA